MGILQNLLAHPLTKGLSVDDPRTTALRCQIIQQKPFLRLLYGEWYQKVLSKLSGTEHVLELGSGAGFFRQYLPNVITSEIFEVAGVQLVADACQLPLVDQCLDAIVMTDVFHHIPDVTLFLNEATRCVRPGGKIVMLEPWRTKWSEWVYINLHPEPFCVESDWKIPSSGPLSGANGALPWIVFERDRDRFQSEFPAWRINGVELMMPISYLCSGGVSTRTLIPRFLYRPVRWLERCFGETDHAMFALIELERVE